MTTIRGDAGRFSTLGVTLETAAMVRKLAGDKPVYRYLAELVERESANRQGTLGRDFPSSGGKAGKDSIGSRLTRIFGSERGRDVLRKMELARWDDGLRQAACDAVLEADMIGISDSVLVGLQSRLNGELKGRVPLPSFGLEASEV